jgi:alpha-glucosidase
VTLPFTRMLAGPMDYTPAGFRNVTPAEFKAQDVGPLVMTTRAQQLAMYVVYESFLQMVADTPSAYRGQPGAEFIRVVPTSWDETRVLAGEIGKYVVVARRRGRDWFIGAMNNEEPREIRVPLNFLGRGAYILDAFADGADASSEPTHLSISTSSVRAGQTLSLSLAPSGGYAAQLRPAR